MLVYDRAGYGRSSISALSRSPRNIATELNKLLYMIGIEEEIVIVGHSQGGLNAVEYALMYPDKVKGLIPLDPATPFDNEFIERLTKEEFNKSGVDKTMTYKAALFMTSIGLGFIMKRLLEKAPPFYYYEFPSAAKEYLLQALCNKNTYKTALSEYNSTHDNRDTGDITKAIKNSSLKGMPIKLITHSSEFFVKELEYYGHLDKQRARKIEDIWQDIMKRYLGLSSETEHIIAPNSGHYIHLTDFEVLKSTVSSLIMDF